MRILFISILIVLMSVKVRAQKTKIIYVGDPLCSWCYGFAPEIAMVKEHFDSLHFQVVIGGLRPYNTETMADLGDFLKEHWEAVEGRSKQPFNYGIIEDKTFVYDTEPPARAVIVMRELNRKAEFEFFKEVQHLFYVENKNTNDVKVYLPLLEKYEVDPEEFENTFESSWAKMEVKKDFQLAQQMNISGFPALLLDHEGKLYVVCKGYAKADAIIGAIEKVVGQ
ncbi:DsbA family protein [Salibacteraceae bacterium]|jgi:putative protein-disulfide isomerase|nr:hypothetical protein [Crocinitomicaceae bacterium]MDA7730397.1 DsbA family protein [Salibacteraceae bacterium]|tara:strand:- start:138605 stop:139276 length:672 start_codon:yes stop_codon:yes gene_type:complete